MDIIPVFTSHYSIADSILTLEEAGKTAIGNPVSICDLAKDNNLKQVVLVDNRFDSFVEAYQNLSKISIQLIFGIKMVVCADITDKTPESLKTESNIIVFIKNSQGYTDLIRLYNRAWTDGFHNQGRVDWALLKAYWTDNLSLALPYFSSFLHQNALTFSNIVPHFPVTPTLFRETDSGLPFSFILDSAIDKFAEEQKLRVQPVKSVYYANSEAFDAFVTIKAIHNRSEFARPNVDHLCSDKFNFAAWKTLAN